MTAQSSRPPDTSRLSVATAVVAGSSAAQSAARTARVTAMGARAHLYGDGEGDDDIGDLSRGAVRNRKHPGVAT
ncbi:hypothetical protein GCM10010357_65860 [Streptomyces luteireticuli]|uniref:Uncharacterized protein n=1 Tax=Streptomyces luteireticuli TaxID=173858 RepID=A0ABN0Z6U3_9ACTN